MAQNYTRQSTLSDGDTITASLFNDEYNQLVNAFTYSSTSASSTGHRHDGSSGQGGNIFKIGDLDFLNKIEVDSTNNRWGFYVEVSSAAVEQIRIQDGAIVPVTTNDIDLGTSSLQFKDLYIDGTANVDSLTLTSGSTVTTILDEDDLSSDSATALVTQQSVKAYVDSQVTAQDLDFQADSGGALSIDLDSEALTLTGGTGIDTSGALNEVTFAIDSTVATLTGTQTLTNKTLTAPTISGNLTTDGTIDGRDVATDGAKLDGIEAGATADQTDAEIRAAVEAATDSNVFTDADHTKLDGIEANATADQTDAEIRAAVEAATDSNVFTDADHSKLDGIEALADVTDTTNVTAAGALMDSELTNLTAVKALDQGVATTDTPTFAAVTVNGNVEFDGLSGTGAVTVTDILDQDDMSSNSATALATQQSIKAYVDTTVAATNELVEDTTPQLGGDLASNGNDILFADSDKAIFGAGSDLQIYHDGSHSYIKDSGTGDLRVLGENFEVRNPNNNKVGIKAVPAAQVELYHNNALKLATTSTGIDVTGTVTADGLTVDGDGATVASVNATTGTGVVGLKVNNTGGNTFLGISNSAGGGYLSSIGNYATALVTESATNLALGTNNAKRLLIGSGGDISFYEDTGTTAKLFWDASAESLGIGTSSPSASYGTLTVAGTGITINEDNAAKLQIGRYNASNPHSYIKCSPNSSGFKFSNASDTADLMVIENSGNVGIGTSSPAFAGSRTGINIKGTTANGVEAILLDSTDSGNAGFALIKDGVDSYVWNRTNGVIGFGTNNTERMRIDSSGNLLVGKTSADDFSSAGAQIEAGGQFTNSVASAPSLRLNRGGTDGDIIEFNKAGTTVGSIAARSGDLLIGTTDVGLRFDDNASAYIPFNVTTSLGRDAGIDLGAASVRYKDLHLSGTPYIGGTSAGQSVIQMLANPTNGANTIHFGDSASGSDTYAGYINYAHDSNSMQFATNQLERMRIDSSGNVLVGQSSTTTPGTGNTTTGISLRGGDGAIHASRSGNRSLYANRNTTHGPIISAAVNGTEVGAIGSAGGYLTVLGSTNQVGLKFYSAAANTGIIHPVAGTSDLDGAVDLGYSAGRFKDLHLSGGVQFGTAGAAAQNLDDYEEGTWTGTLTGSTTAPSTAQTATGTYTKVGNLVTVNIGFSNKDITGASGNAQITGLPFTCGDNAQGTGWNNRVGSGTDVKMAYIGSDNNIVWVNGHGSSLAWSTTGTGTYVAVTITFMVA